MTATPQLDPKVSVIIPAFNHEKFIEGCLTSVRNETYPNIEIVLIDDGSTDSSFRIAQQFFETHRAHFADVKLVQHQTNAGVTKTLNEAVHLAEGDYITLLASDDELLPDGITKRLGYLEANKNLLAVIGDCVVIDEHGGTTFNSSLTGLYHASKERLSNPKLIDLELIFHWSITGPSLLLRKEAFYSPPAGIGLFDEALRVEDRDFYLRLLAIKSLGFIDVPVAKYRKLENSASRNLLYKEKVLSDLRLSNTQNAFRFTGIRKIKLLLMGARTGQKNRYFFKKLDRLLNKIVQLFYF